MNNYIILKWGSLKAYEFSEDFGEKNKDIIEELNSIWNTIHSDKLGAVSGSEYLQSREDLKLRLVEVLEKFYNLGIVFQNGFTDEYYNSFVDIKDYILKYGNE